MTTLYELMERGNYSSFEGKEFSYKGERVGTLRGFSDEDSQFLVFENGNKQTRTRWDVNNDLGPTKLNMELLLYHLVSDDN